jgi:hypothetical protein
MNRELFDHSWKSRMIQRARRTKGPDRVGEKVAQTWLVSHVDGHSNLDRERETDFTGINT